MLGLFLIGFIFVLFSGLAVYFGITNAQKTHKQAVENVIRQTKDEMNEYKRQLNK